MKKLLPIFLFILTVHAFGQYRTGGSGGSSSPITMANGVFNPCLANGGLSSVVFPAFTPCACNDSTDDTASMQQAVTWVLGQTAGGYTIDWLGKTIKMNGTVLCAATTGGATIVPFGYVNFVGGDIGSTGSGTIDATGNTLGPSFVCQGNYGGSFRNITWRGSNNGLNGGNEVGEGSPLFLGPPANFVGANQTDNQYAPIACMVAIDPIVNPAPAGGGYPSLAAYYSYTSIPLGSHGILFDHISVSNGVACFAGGLNAQGSQGDDMSFNYIDASRGPSKVIIANGSTQADGWNVTNFNGGECWCVADDNDYGGKNGVDYTIQGGQITACKWVFSFNGSNIGGSPGLKNVLLEGVMGLGAIGGGVFSPPLNITDVTGRLGIPGASVSAPVDFDLFVQGPFNFIGGTVGDEQSELYRIYGTQSAGNFSGVQLTNGSGVSNNEMFMSSAFMNQTVGLGFYGLLGFNFVNCTNYNGVNKAQVISSTERYYGIDDAGDYPTHIEVPPGGQLIDSSTGNTYTNTALGAFNLGSSYTVTVSGTYGVSQIGKFVCSSTDYPKIELGDAFYATANQAISTQIDFPSLGGPYNDRPLVGYVSAESVTNGSGGATITLNGLTQSMEVANFSVQTDMHMPQLYAAIVGVLTSGSSIISPVTIYGTNGITANPSNAVLAGDRYTSLAGGISNQYVVGVSSTGITMSGTATASVTTMLYDATYGLLNYPQNFVGASVASTIIGPVTLGGATAAVTTSCPMCVAGQSADFVASSLNSGTETTPAFCAVSAGQIITSGYGTSDTRIGRVTLRNP